MKYEIIWTQDGSPSLRDVECMHHRAGAYSETQYIYGEAIRRSLSFNLTEYSVLVVGLGLGYIELIAMGEYLNYIETKTRIPLRMLSFESDDFLKENFLAWLANRLDSSHPLFMVYESIGQFINQKYNLDKIKFALLKAYENHEWVCNSFLGKDTIPTESFHLLLYDAFSGKSTPELWSEEFLSTALKQITCKPAVFSTYACTGVLKRTLKSSGYEVLVREGFSGKRDSTLATLF
jgi:hypothetical protein